MSRDSEQIYEYVVQQVKADVYYVHKFEDSTETPVATYTVHLDHNNKLKCNCPSGANRQGWCIKHRELVKDFRRKHR